MRIVFLDSIRSMQNIGAIFRNADGAGFDKVILSGNSAYPPRKEISKTALGAESIIDWEYFENSLEILSSLRKQGFKIISLELTKDAIPYKDFFSKNLSKNIVLILGNELKGINKNILDFCDNVVYIPMKGKKESLNVSVAAGIAMFSTNIK